MWISFHNILNAKNLQINLKLKPKTKSLMILIFCINKLFSGSKIKTTKKIELELTQYFYSENLKWLKVEKNAFTFRKEHTLIRSFVRLK